MTPDSAPVPSPSPSIKRGLSLPLLPWLLSAVLFTYAPALAQLQNLPGVAQADGAKGAAASPEEQRATTGRALEEAKAERDRNYAAPPGISRQELEERLHLLNGIVTRLSSQLNLIDEREALRKNLAAAKSRADKWSGFSGKPPYSVLMVDEICKQELAVRAKTQGLESTHTLIAQQVATQRDSARRARERERRAAEEVKPGASAEERLPAVWRRELAALRARYMEELAAWSALQHEVLGERLGIARAELEMVERQVAVARKGMVFSRADLNGALARLKGERAGLDLEMEGSLARDARFSEELARIQRGLKEFSSHAGKENGAAEAGMRRDRLETRHRAALAWVENSRFETEVISLLLTINHSLSSLWEKRYAALTGDNPEMRQTTLAEFRRSRETLAPWLKYAQQQLEVYRTAEREQQARLSGLDDKSPLRPEERDLLEARRIQREQAERLNSAFEQGDLTLKSWQEDLERIQRKRTMLDKSRDGIRMLSGVLRRIWHFELFAVEDTVQVAGQKVVTSRGVTVGKSVGALLLFLAGYGVISFLGQRIQRVVVARFGISQHQANIIHRVFLSMAIFSLLFAILNLARIPLTVFAFLGGALAIGVGFGTQTLIKNLISGILILLERKVQVGDTVDVDGVVGTVTSVDIRASTVLGFDGVETMIPNATFLETKVTNWTHTSATLRRAVRVGVAYGSPVARVRDILAECAESHSQVLKSPPPLVLFEDFGDSSLIFVLYFWIDYGPAVNPLKVASDLRFMIERRFGEANIVMAFPQRDIHVSSVQPLRLELVAPGPGDGS